MPYYSPIIGYRPKRYSVEKTIDDLEVLLRKLGIRRFHLYGHSFGAMLAYEYLKRIAERKEDDEEGCLSAVLSSPCTSIPLLESEWARLLKELPPSNPFTANQRFRETHQCRTPGLPEPLARAYRKSGSTWSGLAAIPDYVLTPPSENAARMKSALLIRGEYDFSTEDCVKDFDQLFNHKFLRKKILEGCSHHGLLENGPMYGEILDSYFAEYD